jgi:predicted acylesterase/phospholipase RssA
MASSALPGVFPPIAHQSYYLIDGGITQKLPSRIAYGLGARRVFGVDVGSPFLFKDRFNTPLQVIMRSEEIASQALHERNSDRVNLLLSPDFGDMKWYEFKRHREAFDAGHEEASRNSRSIHRFFQPSLRRAPSTWRKIESEFILE